MARFGLPCLVSGGDPQYFSSSEVCFGQSLYVVVMVP